MKAKRTLIGFYMTLVFSSSAFALQDPDPFDPEDNQIPQAGKRNILIIIADDMGIDRSRQYRSLTGNSPASLPATPNIRKLANSGVTFDNAWANPVCSSTRAGLLTGRHSFRTTVSNALSAGQSGLPDIETTLPELISDAGYVSGLFGKWHLGPGTSGPYYGPLDQGFDEHRGSIEGMVSDYALWDKYENGVPIGPVTTYATLENAEDAVDWIGNHSGRWLAIVAFNAPHTPLHTPTIACDGVSPQGADINGMIECMDHHIGSILAELEAQEQLENTTVIFIGDNGTESASILPPFDLNADSHKGNVYEGGIRVPFIISDGYHLVNGMEAPVSSGIGRVRHPGVRENALVHTVDIFSTVAAIVGVQSHAEDSFSLIPFMASSFRIPMIPLREHMYTDRCQASLFQAAIRNDQYKLIYKYPGPVPFQPELELYDVADMEEINPVTNLAAENLLLYELESMWNSEGYDPATGLCR